MDLGGFRKVLHLAPGSDLATGAHETPWDQNELTQVAG